MFFIVGLIAIVMLCLSLKSVGGNDSNNRCINRVEQRDRTNNDLRKTVRDLSKIHNGIILDYERNELSVAMALEVSYTEFVIEPLEYPTVKKIKNYKNISHILIMLVVEKYDKKGFLHYGFVYKDEDIYEAAKKILAGDSRSFRIDLSPSNDKYEWLSPPKWVLKDGRHVPDFSTREQRSLNWLSESAYKLQLNAPRGAKIDESYGNGVIMLAAYDSVTSFEFGLAYFGEKLSNCGMQPDRLAFALLGYAMKDFQEIKKAKVQKWLSPD
jgi:hypothetical protein